MPIQLRHSFRTYTVCKGKGESIFVLNNSMRNHNFVFAANMMRCHSKYTMKSSGINEYSYRNNGHNKYKIKKKKNETITITIILSGKNKKKHDTWNTMQQTQCWNGSRRMNGSILFLFFFLIEKGNENAFHTGPLTHIHNLVILLQIDCLVMLQMIFSYFDHTRYICYALQLEFDDGNGRKRPVSATPFLHSSLYVSSTNKRISWT